MSSAFFVKLVTWLGLLGIPSIFTIAIWCFGQCKKYAKNMKILMSAQKAQMRSQLLNLYHEYEAMGWVSEENLEDWENQYKAYHELVGDNGVLDARRAKLLNMPNQRPEKQNLE